MSSIIISKNHQDSQRIEESAFGKEDSLQEYLYNNPDIVPVYEIDDDAKLFIAAREFSTAHGPIDALGFDHDGNIYVVETKLYKNADKRRVVAQALDYGAALWRYVTSFDDFIAQLDNHAGKSFREAYEQFFELEDSAEQMQAIRENLSDGNLRFVVLIDRLDEQLRDVILYVNQNSKFDIYAVDFKYYQHKEFEIVIPRLYGAEVVKTVESSAKSSRRQWNEKDFFEVVDNDRELVSPEQRDAVYKIWEWAQKGDAKIKWGTGAVRGKFSPVFHDLGYTRSFCSIAFDSSVAINYGYLDDQEDRKLLRDVLKAHTKNACPNVTEVQDNELPHKYPTVAAEIAPKIVDKVIAAFDEFIERKRQNGNK